MTAPRVVAVADTHLPKRAKDLPSELWAAIESADVVVHAGDWVDEATLDAFEARSRSLVGCFGNNDDAALRERLPELARVELAGRTVGVIHETGAATGRERRMDAAHPGLDLLVFGHSHIPWDTTTPGGLRLVNPGSPTDRRRQPFRTYAVIDLHPDRIDVDVRRLPPR